MSALETMNTRFKKGQHPNPSTEFKKGVHSTPHTEFKKGLIPWHKGRSGVYSKETLEKMRLAKLGRKLSQEQREKMGLAHKGHITSEETKLKIASALRGKKRSAEVIEKLRIAGSNKSPEVRQKLRMAQLGKKLSLETRIKIGKSNLRERHWNWQGGISNDPYPLGWTKTFKEQIRKRDDYKCQICCVPETECLQTLAVHHIDYDKKNLSIDNLVSLCFRCHSETNHNREYWKEYFKERNYVV